MKNIIFSSLKVLPKLNMPNAIINKTPNINKIRSISSVYKQNLAYNNTSSCKTSRKNTKIKKTLEIIHKLNLESNIRDIYMEEKKLEKKREKINENQEIKEKRLGLFKEKESGSRRFRMLRGRDRFLDPLRFGPRPERGRFRHRAHQRYGRV